MTRYTCNALCLLCGKTSTNSALYKVTQQWRFAIDCICSPIYEQRENSPNKWQIPPSPFIDTRAIYLPPYRSIHHHPQNPRCFSDSPRTRNTASDLVHSRIKRHQKEREPPDEAYNEPVEQTRAKGAKVKFKAFEGGIKHRHHSTEIGHQQIHHEDKKKEKPNRSERNWCSMSREDATLPCNQAGLTH